MSNNSELIKELRSQTGAGFLDCKTALNDSNNDIDKAVEFLRKKGLSKASKKTSREANEGAVGIYYNDKIIVLIKMNSETDFAAKSDTFLDFLNFLGEAVLNSDIDSINKDNFLNYKYIDKTISEHINAMIAKIGENLILNELVVLQNDTNFSFYVHNSYSENIGKIISITKFNTDKNDKDIEKLMKNICMHVAAMKPESLDIDDLSNQTKENERKIQKELILNSGKPDNIAEKILEGKMKKFYSEITLLNQTFILDQDKTVNEVLTDYKDGYNLNLRYFKYLSL